MDIRGPLIERLARGERNGLATVHSHHDGAFEHIDETVRVVFVDRVGAAWRILHREHEHFFSGKLRERLGHQRRHHRVCSVYSSDPEQQRQQKSRLHIVPLWVASSGRWSPATRGSLRTTAQRDPRWRRGAAHTPAKTEAAGIEGRRVHGRCRTPWWPAIADVLGYTRCHPQHRAGDAWRERRPANPRAARGPRSFAWPHASPTSSAVKVKRGCDVPSHRCPDAAVVLDRSAASVRSSPPTPFAKPRDLRSHTRCVVPCRALIQPREPLERAFVLVSPRPPLHHPAPCGPRGACTTK